MMRPFLVAVLAVAGLVLCACGGSPSPRPTVTVTVTGTGTGTPSQSTTTEPVTTVPATSPPAAASGCLTRYLNGSVGLTQGTAGDHVWHVHADTDEFFLVLDGRFEVALRDQAGRESMVSLGQGDVFVVPKGTEHKPSSPGGSILMFEPSQTLTTGDWHEGDIPAHVHSTTGQHI